MKELVFFCGDPAGFAWHISRLAGQITASWDNGKILTMLAIAEITAESG